MAQFKFVIPRMNDITFEKFANPSLKKLSTNAQVLQVFDKDKSKPENIFQKYNAGIEAASKGGLNDDDIIVFMHEDVGIVDQLFIEKIQLVFSEKKDVGILGIAGAIEVTDKGGWWMTTPDKMRGHLIQGKPESTTGEGFHLQKGAIGYFDDLVAIDGCIMVTTGKILKEGLSFDDKTYTDSDFYDIDFCMQVLEKGYKIAVADILIFHQSSGMGVFNEPWKQAKEKFFKKWEEKGLKLPFTPDQFKLKQFEDSEIVEIDI
jgi:GT2 family glycosyltransferase